VVESTVGHRGRGNSDNKPAKWLTVSFGPHPKIEFKETRARPREGTVTLSIERRFHDGLRRSAHPLTGDREDFNPLMALVGDSRFVFTGLQGFADTGESLQMILTLEGETK
jgi:hypothetical protein